MANLKDIRVRIDSTRNTQQITKAMKLVSAAKLRKAQALITNMRPYAQGLLQVIANIAATERISHPLFDASGEPASVLLVVLSSDRGLCGGFNSQITRFTDNYLKSHAGQKTDMIFIGRRAADFFARRGVKGLETHTRLDKEISPTFAAKLADHLLKLYTDGHYQEIRLIYNEFQSAIVQKVVCATLLPIDLKKQTLNPGEDKDMPLAFSNDLIFEPSPEGLIDPLLKRHFEMQVYSCMAESVASEHGARMTAMENATNNAKEVLNKLTLTYNKVRQEKITTELTEIVSGAEAL